MEFRLQDAATLARAVKSLQTAGVELEAYHGNWNTAGAGMDVRPARDGVRVLAQFKVVGALPRDGSNRVYGRRGVDGKRMHHLCWHGHRQLFREVFALEPDAVIKTARVTYRGAVDFEAAHPATGDENIGNYYDPMMFREACDCELPRR